MGCSCSSDAVQSTNAGPSASYILLGPHGAGKTTIIKQLQLSYNQIPQSSRKDSIALLVRHSIRGHLATFTRHVRDFNTLHPKRLSDALVDHCEALAKSLEGDSGQLVVSSVEAILRNKALMDEIDAHVGSQVDKELLAYIPTVLQRVVSEKNEYEPSNEDVLRLHWQTVGTNQIDIHSDKVHITLIDTGGLPQERKKWVNINNISSSTVIFVIASDSFAQTEPTSTASDEKKAGSSSAVNGLSTAIDLFRSTMIRSPPFNARPCILVLTKTDLLPSALKSKLHAFQATFPDYTGGDDAEAALRYMKDFISGLIPDAQRDKFAVMSTNSLSDPTNSPLKPLVDPVLRAQRLKDKGNVVLNIT